MLKDSSCPPSITEVSLQTRDPSCNASLACVTLGTGVTAVTFLARRYTAQRGSGGRAGTRAPAPFPRRGPPRDGQQCRPTCVLPAGTCRSGDAVGRAQRRVILLPLRRWRWPWFVLRSLPSTSGVVHSS